MMGSNYVRYDVFEVFKEKTGWTWSDARHQVYGREQFLADAAIACLESIYEWDAGMAVKTRPAAGFIGFKATGVSGLVYPSNPSDFYYNDGEIVWIAPSVDPGQEPDIETVINLADMEAVFDYMKKAFPSGWTVDKGQVRAVMRKAKKPVIKSFQPSGNIMPPPVKKKKGSALGQAPKLKIESPFEYTPKKKGKLFIGSLLTDGVS